MTKDKNVRPNEIGGLRSRALLAAQITAVSCGLATLVLAAPQSKTSAAAASSQMTFDTPQSAADALLKATADYDVPKLLNILGPDAKDLVSSADSVRDKNNAA